MTWFSPVHLAAACLLAASLGLASFDDKPAAQPAAAEPAKKATLLDKLKPLAGEWEMTAEGKTQLALSIKVSSAGSVVCETMFPGSPHEMTNMYSMDGDALIVTHYCAMGNQPRMRCKAESAPGVLHFVRDGGTNIAKDQTYMGELKLTITGNDQLKHEWQSFKGDKLDEHKVSLELTRKK